MFGMEKREGVVAADDTATRAAKRTPLIMIILIIKIIGLELL